MNEMSTTVKLVYIAMLNRDDVEYNYAIRGRKFNGALDFAKWAVENIEKDKLVIGHESI